MLFTRTPHAAVFFFIAGGICVQYNSLLLLDLNHDEALVTMVTAKNLLLYLYLIFTKNSRSIWRHEAWENVPLTDISDKIRQLKCYFHSNQWSKFVFLDR